MGSPVVSQCIKRLSGLLPVPDQYSCYENSIVISYPEDPRLHTSQVLHYDCFSSFVITTCVQLRRISPLIYR